MVDGENKRANNQIEVTRQLWCALLRVSQVSDSIFVASVTPRQAVVLMAAGAQPIHPDDAPRLKALRDANSSTRRMFYFEASRALRELIRTPRGGFSNSLV